MKMKKLLVAIIAGLYSLSTFCATGATWGPACTEWHFSPDGRFPLAIWSGNTIPYGYCYPDRNWTQTWAGMVEPNHCNPPPNTTVMFDLTQMGVPLDAKVAVFSGILIGTPSSTVNNETVIYLTFCAPSQPCDFTAQVQNGVYTMQQGADRRQTNPDTFVGARAPTTLFAPVENGKIKYQWRVTSNPAIAPDEYFGPSMSLKGWCR